MKNDAFGRTIDEIEDEARHGYAVGTVALRAIADELSQIALKEHGINRWELKRLHDQLYDLYELLGTHTVFGMRDEPVTDGSPKALWAYGDTYSDGTPVTIVAGPPSSRGCSAPSNERSCDIPWLPNIFGNDDYDAEGPIPRGCEVIVVAPPHERKSTARAAWQDGGSAFKDLKARLLEAER
jgi:hypothetical protein